MSVAAPILSPSSMIAGEMFYCGNTLHCINSSKRTSSSDVGRPCGKRRRVDPSSARRIERIASSLSSLSPQDYDQSMNPHAVFMGMLRSRGIDALERPALNVEAGFFHEPTPDEIASYGHDLIGAIRGRDIDALREEHRGGERSLQCCNKFGESLIHMACRRGFTDVVRFLIKEAGVSIRVRDDYGRTPLHDACWTTEPNFELMDLLIATDPDLLLISDKRGNTPLQYVRREHWGAWVKFLEKRRDSVCPRELSGLSLTAQ